MDGKYRTDVNVFYGAQVFAHRGVRSYTADPANNHVTIVAADGGEAEFYGFPYMVIRDPERDEHGQVIRNKVNLA